MMHHAETELLNVAYLEQGAVNKPVVLLLHGWPDDASTWDGVMPQLANAGYHTIAPFLRGFGETKFKKKSTERTGNSGIHALDMIELMDVFADKNIHRHRARLGCQYC